MISMRPNVNENGWRMLYRQNSQSNTERHRSPPSPVDRLIKHKKDIITGSCRPIDPPGNPNKYIVNSIQPKKKTTELKSAHGVQAAVNRLHRVTYQQTPVRDPDANIEHVVNRTMKSDEEEGSVADHNAAKRAPSTRTDLQHATYNHF